MKTYVLVVIILILFGLLVCYKGTVIDGFTSSINPHWSLNTDLDSETYKIAKAIIANINKKLNTNYIFGQFENVIKDSDTNGNKRYIMDFFVYQINSTAVNDVNHRIIVDLTLFYKTKTIQVNTINFSNANKLDLEDNNLQNNKDGLIITPLLFNDKANPMKFTFNEPLEFNEFHNPKPVELSDTDRRPWLLKSSMRAFPCQDYGDWWDENAIPLTYEEENGLPPNKNKPAWCYNSYNTATVPQTIVAQKYPQFVKMPYDQANKEYNWMFDKMQGIAAFPHGGSNTGRS
jgi:hypothetical protein